MTDFDPEKFKKAIYAAKMMVYITMTKDPEKLRILEHMRRLTDELVDHCEELLEG